MARQRRSATGSRTGASEPSSDEIPGATLDAGEPEGRLSPDGRQPEPNGRRPAPGLYLVATPIGNLRDITLRALDVLSHADLVACEDTRVTGRLMQLLGLKAPLTPYHDHNAEAARPALMARLKQGAVVALVSDAGTPLVSDPGYRLVRACVEEGLPVTAVPGASAALTGLQLSGLPSDRFMFAGFLPSKSTARRAALREVATAPATLVFFESPHRVADTLEDMAAVLGERSAAIARELTKMHEEVVRGRLSELAAQARLSPPRGEVVLVVGAPLPTVQEGEGDLQERLRHAVSQGASVKDAAALVAAETGWSRREVYALALKLLRGGNEE